MATTNTFAGARLNRASDRRTDDEWVRGRLADLAPRRLALMHGSSFAGDASTALRELAAHYRRALAPGQEAGPNTGFRVVLAPVKK